MNPAPVMGSEWCQWPVPSPYFGVEARTCGRPGYGAHVRVCWQHRDALNAEVIGALYEHPDGNLSEMLADWVRSTEPSEYDDESRETERARSRRFAENVLTSIVGHYGDLDRMPAYLQDAMAPLIDRLIEARLRENWGDVA